MTNEKKNVPELRFPEFDEEWEEKKLKDISNKGMYGIGASATNFDGENVYVRITDINESTRKLNNDKLTSPNKLDKKYLLNENDVLFARTGASTGKTYIHKHYDIDKNYYFAGFLIKFEFKNNYLANFIFQNTLTKSFENWVSVMSVRSGQPGINSEEYGKLKMMFPRKAEQQKIGEFFSKLDRQIELEEQKLEKLEEQKKGYMQKIFSQQLRFKDENGNDYENWSIKELREILIPGNKERIEDRNNYNRLTVGLHGKGVFRLDQERKTKDTRPFYQRFEGELIIGKQNFFNGSIAIIPKKFNGYICSNAIMSYIFKSNIDSKYVLEYLLQNDFLRKNEFLADGTGQKELSEKKFELLKINIPNCVEEQNKIGNFFNKIDDIIEKKSQKIQLLKERKKGFLQKMFV